MNENAKLYLMEEYKDTVKSYQNIPVQIQSAIKQSYLFNSGLICILSYFSQNFDSHNNLLLIAGLAIPIAGCLISIETINTMYTIRLREVWIYNRLNYIRRIFLSENNENIPIQEYIETPQGSIKPFTERLTWEKLIKCDEFYKINIFIVFISLWVGLLTYIYFFSYFGNFQDWQFDVKIILPVFIILLFFGIRHILNKKLRSMFVRLEKST